MQRQTKSLLEELEDLYVEHDIRHVIEARADNIMASAINLLNLINESYTEDEAKIVTQKFLNGIKNQDVVKFKRGLKRINESKRNNK